MKKILFGILKIATLAGLVHILPASAQSIDFSKIFGQVAQGQKSQFDFCISHSKPELRKQISITVRPSFLVSDASRVEALKNMLKRWASDQKLEVNSIELDIPCPGAEQIVMKESQKSIEIEPTPSTSPVTFSDPSYCIQLTEKSAYRVIQSEMQVEVHITDKDCIKEMVIDKITTWLKTDKGDIYRKTCTNTSYCGVTQKEVGMAAKLKCSATQTENKGLKGFSGDPACF